MSATSRHGRDIRALTPFCARSTDQPPAARVHGDRGSAGRTPDARVGANKARVEQAAQRATLRVRYRPNDDDSRDPSAQNDGVGAGALECPGATGEHRTRTMPQTRTAWVCRSRRVGPKCVGSDDLLRGDMRAAHVRVAEVERAPDRDQVGVIFPGALLVPMPRPATTCDRVANGRSDQLHVPG